MTGGFVKFAHTQISQRWNVMDLLIVLELDRYRQADYDEWRKIFDEDAPARAEFSESMICLLYTSDAADE